jgi:hypothetical protein
MPVWVLGLQVGVALLQALQPYIEAAVSAATTAGEDVTPHTTALTEVTDAIAGFKSVLARVA